MIKLLLAIPRIKPIILIIIFLLVGLYSIAQEMTLYALPATGDIDWRSPHTVLSSQLKNTMTKTKGAKRHDMGHVMIELKDDTHYALIGMAPASKKSMKQKVLVGGYGFGGFYYGFEGKLEEQEVNAPDLERRIKNGTVAYVKIKLGAELFERVWKYGEEYKRFGYDKIYNGTNRPRCGEGAGCSAFAMSFLEVAGLPLKNITDEWIVSVPVHEKLVGGPAGEGRYVHLLSIFLKFRWADTTQEQYRVASYYEPTVMYKWINERYICDNAGANEEREITGKARGLAFDYRHARIPDEPIWFCEHKEVPVKAQNLAGKLRRNKNSF